MDLDRLLAGVRDAAPSRVVVLGIAEFASTPLFLQPLRAIAGKRADMLDRDVRAAARKHDALFVDIKGRTGRAFVEDPRRHHARDGFHPSDDGYRLWAEATLDAIRDAVAGAR